MENEQFQEFVIKHLKKLSEDVSSLKGDVSSLKKTMLRVETRMETELIHKIQVLFDGYQQHEERFNRIEKKLGINM